MPSGVSQGSPAIGAAERLPPAKGRVEKSGIAVMAISGVDLPWLNVVRSMSFCHRSGRGLL
jgi:hypothetical protein